VFLVAAVVALVGFALSWFMEERPLRAAPATSQGLEDSLAAPREPDSLAELERALTRLTTREQREHFHRRVAERAGVRLSPGAAWALVRIDEHGFADARAMAVEQGVRDDRIAAVVAELRGGGLVGGSPDAPDLTPKGRTLTGQVVTARRELLAEALADESAGRRPEVDELLRRLARELVGERP
jgi:DNA-binding MarR family transcriptional regulator